MRIHLFPEPPFLFSCFTSAGLACARRRSPPRCAGTREPPDLQPPDVCSWCGRRWRRSRWRNCTVLPSPSGALDTKETRLWVIASTRKKYDNLKKTSHLKYIFFVKVFWFYLVCFTFFLFPPPEVPTVSSSTYQLAPLLPLNTPASIISPLPFISILTSALLNKCGKRSDWRVVDRFYWHIIIYFIYFVTGLSERDLSDLFSPHEGSSEVKMFPHPIIL